MGDAVAHRQHTPKKTGNPHPLIPYALQVVIPFKGTGISNTFIVHRSNLSKLRGFAPQRGEYEMKRIFSALQHLLQRRFRRASVRPHGRKLTKSS
jgi:hypothetical protein